MCGGVTISPSRTRKMFSPEPSQTWPGLVEQDRLVVAGVGGLGLGEDRVQVLAGCLRVRDQPVRRDPPPGGDLGADPVALALLAEIGAPRPDGDDHVDRRRLRVEPHLAVPAERERADVAAAKPVAADQLVGRIADLVDGVRERQVVHLGRPPQAARDARDGGRSPGRARSRSSGCPRTPRCRSGGRGESTWTLASSQATNSPFIQIHSDFSTVSLRVAFSSLEYAGAPRSRPIGAHLVSSFS